MSYSAQTVGFQPIVEASSKGTYMWGGNLQLSLNSLPTPQSQRRCTMDSSWLLHTGQTLSQFISLAAKTSLNGMLSCMHNQRKFAILGRISSFHIHCPWNWLSEISHWFASWYAELVEHSASLEYFHMIMSLPFPNNWIGIALILFLMDLGRSKEMSSQFQSWPWHRSATFMACSSCRRGPSIMALRESSLIQLSSHTLTPEPLPIPQKIPFLKMGNPRLVAFQFGD